MYISRIFVTSILFIIIIVPILSIDFQCQANARMSDPPLLNIPTSVILDTNATEKHPDLYVVAQETSSFVINCTSNLPVDWKFKGSIGNAIVNSKRTFSFGSFQDGILNQTCYYSALEFTAVEDEITGEYTCIVMPQAFPDSYAPLSNGKKSFKLFSGVSALTVRNRTLTYNNWFEESVATDEYEIPCAANHPKAQLRLLYQDKGTTEWTVENSIVKESLGLSITINLPQNQLPRRYKCEGKFNNLHSEILFIDIPNSPDTLSSPKYSGAMYSIPIGNSHVFQCLSKYPVTINKTDTNILTKLYISANVGTARLDFRKKGYMYQVEAILKTTVPKDRKIHTPVGQVACIEQESKKHVMEWNYTLIDVKKDSNNKSNTIPLASNGYWTITSSAENATVIYIKANTVVEISLRLKCLKLHEQNWGLCNHRLPSLPTKVIKSVIAYFQIPGNISGVFQWIHPSSTEKSNFFILKPDGQYGNESSSVLNFLDLRIDNVNVEVGSTLKAQCVSSDFAFYGSTFWVFIWENETSSAVSETSIVNDTFEKHESLTVRCSDILVETTKLKRLACYAISDTVYQVVHKRSDELQVTPKRESGSINTENTAAVTITISLTSLAVVTAIIVSLLYWIKSKKYAKKDIAFQECVHDFFEGYELIVKEENNLCSEADSKPYDKEYEIPMENLKIAWESPLGSGAFGFVLKGTWCKTKFSTLTTVAVKTIKNNVNTECITALMAEIKVMIYIGKHPHVVNLLGACTENLCTSREIYVVMEFCKHGSLRKHLKENSSNFNNGDSYDQTKIEKSDDDSELSQYQLTAADMFQWSRQIACGMEHLASKKVIHGDLACRNVLLDEFLTAKISDFGLSRRLYERCEYVKKSDDPLPWRWLAPESLKDMKFSEESDVWSFGVTLWEIFSLAKTPYSELVYSPDFAVSLENNFRLEKPEHSTDELYNHVIIRCWEYNPCNRPTFQQLNDVFGSILNEFGLRQI